MPTTPSYPIMMNLLDVGAYFQNKKNKGQDLTAEAVIIRETGDLIQVINLAGTYYVCGSEYCLPSTALVAQPYSANGTSVLKFAVPVKNSVMLTGLDLTSNTATTLDGTHYWTVTVKGRTAADTTDAGVTSDNSAGTAAADYTHTLITTFATNPLPAGAKDVELSVTKTSTPGNLTLTACLTGRVVFATLT